MLSLAPPFRVIEGVSILPDHEDPNQFWHLPLRPQLTTVDGVPQVQVILYRGATANGGFLNFDCDLALGKERHERILAALADLAPDEPHLSPVPLVDGSVRMVLLGKESPPPPDAPKPPAGSTVPPPPVPGAPQFVTKVQHHGKPSLYGDNNASFSVQLDQEGVTILEQAIKGELSPIGVVYSLSYVGLRPAYEVRVDADWDRVQKHLSDRFEVSTLFYSSQIDHVVDELIESRAIVIEADTFIAEGDGDDAARGRAAQALDEVREMVTETFFEPSLEPITDEQPGGDFAATVERLSKLGATGGLGSMFQRREVDVTRIDRKRLNARFSERTAVIRQMHPQGHLAGLFAPLRDGLDEARFILRVTLDNPFFQRRTVRVLPYVDWAAGEEQPDRVQSLEVSLTYEGQTKDLVFDAAHQAEQTVEWASVLDGEAMRRDVQATCTVNFAPSPAFGRPMSVQVPLAVEQGDALVLQPRGTAYEVRPITINSVDFPLDRWPTAEIELRYVDEANGIDQHRSFVLRQDAAEQFTWPVFALDPAKRAIQHRIVLHGADGRDLDLGWQTTEEDQVRIADPFPRKRTVAVVVPSGIFPPVDRVFVDLAYDDPANGVSKQASLEFTATDTATKAFVVELVDPARRSVRYKATFLMADGTTVEVPESTTADERVLLRPDMKGRRTVAVRCAPVEFGTAGLKEVVAELKYEDAAQTVLVADTLRFSRGGEERAFEFDLTDVAHDEYAYRFTHQYLNGLSRTTEWQRSDAPDLTVPVA